MAVNIEQLPQQIREDVEDQSLDILQQIQQHIVVIGGWAVRSYTAHPLKYARYTLDIDAVAAPGDINTVHEILIKKGFVSLEERDWGIQFYKPYQPHLKISCDPALFKDLQIRIEISPPRIHEIDTQHYFEFDLSKTTQKTVVSHGKHQCIQPTVPEIEYLTANKLGLPADYKNRYDAAVLLLSSDLQKTLEIIQKTDNWKEMVLRRLPRFIGRTKDKGDIAYLLLRRADIDVQNYLDKLFSIKQKLQK
jgi:hypothetical protein